MLSLLDNLVVHSSARDVTAAYCLARAEVRVRFPLGALLLVGRLRVCFQDVGKSGNPRAPEARDRWFKSSRPDLIAVVSVLVGIGGC